MCAAVAEGRECQVVLGNCKKDGTFFWNELSISPVHDDEGNLANFVGLLRDITKRKRVEKALRDQTEALEKVDRIGRLLSSELDLQRLVQAVTDEATEITRERARVPSAYYGRSCPGGLEDPKASSPPNLATTAAAIQPTEIPNSAPANTSTG